MFDEQFSVRSPYTLDFRFSLYPLGKLGGGDEDVYSIGLGGGRLFGEGRYYSLFQEIRYIAWKK